MAAVVCIVFTSATVLAASPRVDAAQRAYDELRFEDVLAEVAAARREGGLARGDDLELTRLEAFTYAVFDDRDRAVDAFGRLLRIDPAYQLPENTSPKIRGYFADARAQVKPVDVRPVRRRQKDPPFYASGWFWGTLVVTIGLGVGAGILLEKD